MVGYLGGARSPYRGIIVWNMETDEALLEAWCAGDRRRGNELFQRHFEPIRRFFVNKVDADAGELVQKTFLACIDAQARFEGRSSFRTFLYAIAHNVLREHYRERRKARGQEEVEELSVVDLGAGPSTMLAAKREQRALLEALRRIPMRYQVVLELYYWEKLTGAELGEILGVPEDTARSRIRRGKELLEGALRRLALSKAVVESTVSDLDDWAESVRGQLQGSR